MDLVQLTTTKETGRKYWRSLDQLAGTSEFAQWIEREFPASASEMLDGTSRRGLLKLMAASFGLAGLTACRRPVEHILPNVRGAEDYVPGRPLFYNTAMSLGGAATGLTVKVNDGRPTKIEGNPNHPFSFGRANSYHQAAVLGMYDPDRSTTPRADNRTATWDEILALSKGPFSPAKLGGGDGLRFLSEKISSPSLQALKTAALQKFPKAKWVEYDSIPQEEAAQGAELAFGQPVHAVYHFDKADVVLSLDSDFLGLDAQTIQPQKTFSDRRRAVDDAPELNRLYVVESQFSITGANADHRLRLRSSDIRDFASDLAGEMKVGGNELKVLSGSSDEKRKRWLAAVAKDLNEHKGKSIVVAGPRQPAAVHALAYLINQSLGNIGTTISFYKGTSDQTVPQLEALRGLAGEMSRGQVSHLVILGGNPVYTAPADFDFEANLKKVANSVYLGFEPDETAAASKWLIPEAHFLESWGDVVAPDGTVTLQQPMIEPLFGGKTAAEVVAMLTGNKDLRSYDIVRSYWLTKLGGEKGWRKALHDGVVVNTAATPVTPTLNAQRVNAASQGTAPKSGMELVFLQSAATYDGRFANNGWLQELPEPMSKLTWDNAALVSPATAKQLGLKHGDVIAIERGGRSIEAPVVVQPGQADNSVAIALGYGRTECGQIGKGVGVNAYKLRTSDAFGFATDVSVKKTGREYPLALTQEHNVVEELGATEVQRRVGTLIREHSVEEFKKEPKFAEEMVEHPPLISLYGDWDYSKGQQWGMAIDLNSCIGCNACMIACQAENNIPIVGKEQVARGREMHWIRLDRYYKGDQNDPESVTQPIPCMQCETAPCENVCPVAATTHSPEGLNDMAYNRCVGTRYCSNNCPYKVRRFNFLNWHYGEQEVHKMVFNPDVTVRMRGVMEKCTYCVQRIQEKKIDMKTAERRQWVNDGEVQTACQQTCPADAIVFGNINDKGSRVAKMKAQSRNYAMLAELNTKPRTTFLAKLRNPNPELEAQHNG